MKNYVRVGRGFGELLNDRAQLLDALHQAPVIEEIVMHMASAFLNGRRIYWCGNGGSAAQAQHLAAEFTGRFLRERRGLPSEALSTNSSTVTAIGNDFGYEFIFSRQLEAFAEPGDVVIGLTTSGRSANIVRAFETCKRVGSTSVALTGNGGGPVADLADISLVGPSGYSAIVQEFHLIIGHILCDLVEQRVIEAEAQKANANHNTTDSSR